MRINTNISSITAQEAAVNTGNNIKNSLEKLSTGLRINKASDDASGLAIADKLRTQATSIDQGVTNGNSAVTLLQIADKSMAEQSNILDTVKAKLIQANTDTTSADGRESIRKDISKLLEQLDNIAEQTNYNGNILLQSSSTSQAASADLSFQIGETSADLISNTAIRSNTEGLGLAATEETTATLVAADNTTYTATIASGTEGASGGASATFTTTGSATIDEIHAGLTAAIVGDTTMNSLVSVTAQDTTSTATSATFALTAATSNTAMNISLTAQGADSTSGVALTTTTAGVAQTTAHVTTIAGGALTGAFGSGDTLSIAIGGETITVTADGSASGGSNIATGNVTSANLATALAQQINAMTTGYTAAVSNGSGLTITEDTAGNANATIAISGANAPTVTTNSGTASVVGAAEVETVTITALAGAQTYSLDVAGQSVTFDAASGATATEIRDGLVLAAASLTGFTAANGVSGPELTITNNSAGTFAASGKNNVNTDIAESVTIAAGTGEALASLKDLAAGTLTKELASSYQAVVDDAITDLNGYRGDIGSTQNQVESAVRNLMTQSTNVKAAESIIRDVDYAAESANFNKQNIISQAGSYAISQANSVQQNVLRLLQ